MRYYSPFRHIGALVRKSRPIHCTVFLTRRCTSRCSFCFYLHGTAPAAGEAELSLAELERLAAGLGRLLWLAFSGGEIFLRRDLAEIVQHFYRHNRPAIILLPTNGQQPERIAGTVEQILHRCPRSTVVAKISLDGPAELHDRLRGVPGSHAKAVRTLRLLDKLRQRHANLELGCNTVFCAANQGRMDEIMGMVRTLAPGCTHTLSLVRGTVGDPALLAVDPRRYREACRRLADSLAARHAGLYRFCGAGLKAAQDVVQRRLIHRMLLEGRRRTPCYAGRLSLVVTEQGDLFPCETFSPAMKMGNLRQGNFDLKTILRSPAAAAILAGIAKKRCHCTHECFLMLSILFSPSFYPEIFRHYFRQSAGRRRGAPEKTPAHPHPEEADQPLP